MEALLGQCRWPALHAHSCVVRRAVVEVQNPPAFPSAVMSRALWGWHQACSLGSTHQRMVQLQTLILQVRGGSETLSLWVPGYCLCWVYRPHFHQQVAEPQKFVFVLCFLTAVEASLVVLKVVFPTSSLSAIWEPRNAHFWTPLQIC